MPIYRKSKSHWGLAIYCVKEIYEGEGLVYYLDSLDIFSNSLREKLKKIGKYIFKNCDNIKVIDEELNIPK